jgi:hypothetical protein
MLNWYIIRAPPHQNDIIGYIESKPYICFVSKVHNTEKHGGSYNRANGFNWTSNLSLTNQERIHLAWALYFEKPSSLSKGTTLNAVSLLTSKENIKPIKGNNDIQAMPFSAKETLFSGYTDFLQLSPPQVWHQPPPNKIWHAFLDKTRSIQNTQGMVNSSISKCTAQVARLPQSLPTNPQMHILSIWYRSISQFRSHTVWNQLGFRTKRSRRVSFKKIYIISTRKLRKRRTGKCMYD